MLTATPAAPAAAPEDFCLFAHLKPTAFFQALTRGESFVWVLAISLTLRLGLAAIMPFTADEAYAVVVSRSHSLSYYDHPPLMFALARLMADLTGSETPFYLRLPFVLMGTASTAFLYDITRQCFGARAGFWASAAFSVSPFFLTFGQLLIVPDGPLDLFLLISFWAMLPILLHDKSSLLNWIIAGGALAFALMSKYQAVLFGIGALLALISDKKGRKHLMQPGCWIAFLIAALGLVPILVWNAQHDWISFTFQTARTYHSTRLITHLGNLVGVLMGQAIYLLPGVWLTAQKAIWRGLKQAPTPSYRWLAMVGFLPILIFDLIGLVGHHSLPHWAMSGFLFALPLVGDVRARTEKASPKPLMRKLWLSGLIVSIVAILICLQSQTACLTRYLYKEAPRFDMGWQNLDWSSPAVDLPTQKGFIVTPDWVQAGHAGLAFGANHPILVLTDPHQFQFMDQKSLSHTTTGYFIEAVPLDQRTHAMRTAMSGLSGQYRITGSPVLSTQKRLGFPSFQLFIVPVEKRID